MAYRSNGDLPEFAGTDRVVWTIDPLAFTLIGGGFRAYSPEVTRSALQGAADQWKVPNCGEPELQIGIEPGGLAVAGDGKNTVTWITEGWVAEPTSPAYTDLTIEKSDGKWTIVDADIYLNGTHKTFATDQPDERYLQAVIAHELGHALGLIHPCELQPKPGEPECGLGDYGGALMHPLYDPARVAISSDERSAICFLYPEVKPPPLEPYPYWGCRRNEDCTAGLTCDAGQCVGTEGEIGDPCGKSRQCRSGACDGICKAVCLGDGDCEPGEECKPTDGPNKACTGGPNGYGEKCKFADDCMSSVCVKGATKRPLCSRGCSTDESCAADFVCEKLFDVEGKVCVPNDERSAPSDGCALQRPSEVEGKRAWPWLGLLLAMTRVVRRRSRREDVGA